MSCRYFGISRHTYYRWLRRYQELGPEGLRERSRRPLVCPHATKAEVVGKILHLRQHYHLARPRLSPALLYETGAANDAWHISSTRAPHPVIEGPVSCDRTKWATMDHRSMVARDHGSQQSSAT